jgi:hypothetical protein
MHSLGCSLVSLPAIRSGRPTDGKVCCHIAPNEVGLEPFSMMGLTVALIGAFLGTVREKIARVNGRGISFKLAAEGAWAAV